MQSKQALNDLLRNSVFIDDRGKITITSWETDKTINEQCDVIRKELDYAETMHTLEGQLDCPLSVILKLIDQNELYYQFYDELQHWTSIKIDLRKKVVWYCKQVGGHYACNQPLSNYGKTFWLRKDKSE